MSPTRPFIRVFTCFAFCLAGTFLALADDAEKKTVPAAAEKKIDFERDIAPIFKAHCVSCHGEEMQEGGLRLDLQTTFVGDSGLAIQPGKGAESLLVQNTAGLDPDSIMPPEGDRLSKDQIALLRAWIDQGAKWPKEYQASSLTGPGSDHWAFQQITRPEIPKLKGTDEVRSPIDAFILAKLEAAGINPSKEADRVTLIRRLSLDLLGLPPTPEEVEAFENDMSPEAYERLVDRLLKSKHFGERWGRHWLDMARYADSDGYEKDRPRPNAWKWRDWVLDAVNSDMPFDQFTIEQLAGDLLPNATPEQKLATAFHRQTLTNTEGGTDKEEFRVEAVVDRVNTTGAVWLGLTVGCAQCHSHKYDPISQVEYYRLFAYFDNGDETTMKMDTSEDTAVEYERLKGAYDFELAELEHKLDLRRKELEPAWQSREEDLRAMLDDNSLNTKKFHPLREVAASSDGKVKLEQQDDGSVRATGPVADKANYTLIAQSDVMAITGFQIEALADDSLPKNGPGRADNGNFVVSEVEIYSSETEKIDDKKHRLALRTAIADFSQTKFPAPNVVDGNQKTGWAVGPQSGMNRELIVKLQDPLQWAGKAYLKFVVRQQHGSKHTLGRLRITAMTGDDPRDDVPKEIRHLLAMPSASRTAESQQKIQEYLLSRDVMGKALLDEIADLKKTIPIRPLLDIRVITQRTSSPRTTHILRRGDFLQPQAEVEPGVLAALKTSVPEDTEDKAARLELAHWLMSPENPLTARVAVNHIWKHLFGAGLVSTVSDFGLRGEKPTHPQLLDWLADEYMKLGWSRKQLIKRIVMSAAYQRDSKHREELAEIDPTNQLLARQNRFRVEAEIVRDVTLAASGLLSRKVGGPSVYPPMPADVAALSYANNFRWETSGGEDRFRRGMYTFFKRTSPYPNLAMFDCPDANTSCVDRNSSNTPLQALATLNNQVYVEAARALAKRLLLCGFETDEERIDYAFQSCLARLPSNDEQAELLGLVKEARGWYGEHPEEATKMIGTYHPTGFSAEETAAWAATSRIVMNFDEFITRE